MTEEDVLLAIKSDIAAFQVSCNKGTRLYQQLGIDVTATPQEILRTWRNEREVALWNWGCECAASLILDIINEHIGNTFLNEP